MIKLLITGRLAKSKSPEAAFAHMRDVHGPMVYDPPTDVGPMPVRYAQNHGFSDESLGAWRSDRQFVTEIWFDDVAQFKAATSTPYYLDRLRPDETNFVDQSSVRAVLTQPRLRRGQEPHGAVRLFVFLKRREPCTPADLSTASDEAFAAWAGEPAIRFWESDDALAPPPGQTAFADRVEILSFADRAQATAFARARLASLGDRLESVLDAQARFALLADAYPVNRLRLSRVA